MKMLLEAINMIKRVYKYEKSVQIDIKGLQSVLFVLATVLFLLDVENYKLGKYAIGIIVLVSVCILLFAVFTLKYYQKNIKRLCLTLIFILLLFAFPIAFTGANDGFAMLWYMLLPIITLILMGMPIGAPICIVFGLFTMILFWSPVSALLQYQYAREYLFYYPFFYCFFCLIVVVMDIFYKIYQMEQIEHEKQLEAEVQEAVAQTQGLMVASVATISQMLDEKDGYTQEHSKRVAEYSKLIAQNLKSVSFSEEEISLIYRSALMHDIGKIAVPDAVLNKPARLTDEEYEIMKKHTIWGKEILSSLKFLPQADLGANYHHERYDGTGYPYGMRGESLPLMVRIISAADALDAMNSNRCYREHCGKEYIINEFKKGAGTQFDSEIAERVVALVEEGRIAV